MLKRLAVILLFFCLSSAVFAQDLMHVRIDSINSPFDEFNPMLSPDGSRLYVTRRGHAQNIAGVIDPGDIWYAEKTDAGWTKLKHAGVKINHQGLNGVVGFSRDGNRMYLLNYFDTDGNGGGSLRNGLAVSHMVNGEWSSPERLNIKYFQNRSSHLSATISSDEKILILAMESFITEGNEDLYVSFRQENGEWTQPESLGTDVNTYGQEWTPYLAADNKTLYFSSNARNGEGSRDIYVTVREEGSWTSWSTPKNLGPRINTSGVETGFYIPTNASEAFFSSTQNSEGSGDIFNYPLADDMQEIIEDDIVVEEIPTVEEEVDTSPSMVVMTFQVLDKETERPVNATVTLSYSGEELVFETANLGADQKFMKAFKEGDSVKVEIKASGYLDYQEEFIAMATPSNLDAEFSSNVEAFYLTKGEIGTAVRIENIFFKRGSESFTNPEVAQKQIDQLVTMMQDNELMRIRLEGHTDDRGDASLLESLSEARVMTVKRYMVSKGIAEDRIEILGLGGARPIATNDTESGREMNRRVEFVIIR